MQGVHRRCADARRLAAVPRCRPHHARAQRVPAGAVWLLEQELAPEILAAYEAPFPDPSYAAAVRAMPGLVPTTPRTRPRRPTGPPGVAGGLGQTVPGGVQRPRPDHRRDGAGAQGDLPGPQGPETRDEGRETSCRGAGERLGAAITGAWALTRRANARRRPFHRARPAVIRIAVWAARSSGRGGNTASPPQKCQRYSLVCSYVPVPAAPAPAQQAILRGHPTHARYVWNLAVEQRSHWRPGRKKFRATRGSSGRSGRQEPVTPGWPRRLPDGTAAGAPRLRHAIAAFFDRATRPGGRRGARPGGTKDFGS